MFDRAALDALIAREIAVHHLPGMSVAVIANGERVYDAAFGYRDLVRRLPFTSRTLAGVGSVTKSLTALAVMQLHEQGRLDLDDPRRTLLTPDAPAVRRNRASAPPSDPQQRHPQPWPG